MSTRAASRLAWSLWTLNVVLTALSLLLVVLSPSHPNTPVFAWWFSNTFIVIAATTFVSEYAIYALLIRPETLPAGEVSAWIASWSLPIIIGLQVSYLMLFPTGRLPSRRWRPVAWLIGVVLAVGAISSAFTSDAYMGSLGPIRNPLAIDGFSEVYRAVWTVMFPFVYLVAASSLFVR